MRPATLWQHPMRCGLFGMGFGGNRQVGIAAAVVVVVVVVGCYRRRDSFRSLRAGGSGE